MIAETYRIPTLDGGWVEVDRRNGTTTVKVTQAKGDQFSAQTSAVDLDDDGTQSLIDELSIPNVTRLSDRPAMGHPVASGDTFDMTRVRDVRRI